ncbi:hypothetical protein [Rhizobium sp. S9]|uniref:hypothetical protein n=1 Tax=Rhizobium sp. S9 TaxID=2035454 RepID=UPI001485203B|nr:hypothetical protein [Rhizobium sp. S9]
MNTNVFGIVIGFMGSIVIIRVSPTLDVLQFHEWELQVVDDDEIPPPQSAEQPVPDNVVQVDFTKKRRLRPDTTTEGAA